MCERESVRGSRRQEGAKRAAGLGSESISDKRVTINHTGHRQLQSASAEVQVLVMPSSGWMQERERERDSAVNSMLKGQRDKT